MRRHFQALILATLALTLMPLAAQDETKTPVKTTPPAKEEPAPKTLEEAHRELERILPEEELAKIDAMKSEKDMIEYHFSLGMSI